MKRMLTIISVALLATACSLCSQESMDAEIQKDQVFDNSDFQNNQIQIQEFNLSLKLHLPVSGEINVSNLYYEENYLPANFVIVIPPAINHDEAPIYHGTVQIFRDSLPSNFGKQDLIDTDAKIPTNLKF